MTWTDPGRRRTVLATVVALMAIGFGPGGAQATPLTGIGDEVASLTDDSNGAQPSLLSDAVVKTYAVQAQVSEEQARADLLTQRAAGNIGKDVSDRLKDRYAGLYFEPSTGRFLVPVARGGDATEAQEVFAQRGLGEIVDVVSVQWSYDEMAAAQHAIYEDARDEFDRGNATMYLDVKRNRIVLQHSEKATPDDVAALDAAARKVEVPVDDSVVADAYIKAPTPHACGFPHCDRPLRGGVAMWGGAHGCTLAGLAVSGSQKYMITAGHCAGAPYNAVHYTTSQWHVIGSYGGAFLGWQGDFMKINATGGWWDQVGWSPVTAVWGYSDAAPNWGIGVAFVNQWLWHEGITTGTQGGTVSEMGRWVTYTSLGVTIGGQVVVHACGDEGDSGGPWQLNGYIFGVHSGGWDAACSAPGYEAYHSEARNVQYHLGVTFAGAG